VTVNAVCPGFVDTEMVASAVPEMARHLDVADADVIPTLVKRVPIGRMLHSDEVAALITYLASPSAAGMTGQGVTLDGGLILV
jgi:NAD(P)-dependent dehydrogenase (short-subunit alcohol dehydrogenase family)